MEMYKTNITTTSMQSTYTTTHYKLDNQYSLKFKAQTCKQSIKDFQMQHIVYIRTNHTIKLYKYTLSMTADFITPCVHAQRG